MARLSGLAAHTTRIGSDMKLVIFDCDGTLVDSQHIIYEAMTRAFLAAGLAPLPRPAVLSIVGLSLPIAVARLLPTGSDPRLIEQVSDAYKAAFGELRRDPMHHEPMFPGAAETVAALSARGDVVLGVATGKSRRGVDALFERFGLHPHFVTIQTADNHPSKPHPSMVLEAMAEAGVEPDRTIMIGDTTFDIEMARAAGAGAIGVDWGYHARGLLEAAGAHHILATFPDLPGALDRLYAGGD